MSNASVRGVLSDILSTVFDRAEANGIDVAELVQEVLDNDISRGFDKIIEHLPEAPSCVECGCLVGLWSPHPDTNEGRKVWHCDDCHVRP